MSTIHKLVFNPFEENTYIIYDDSGECMIIDPGCYEKSEQQELVEFIEKNELTPVKLVNTHCHIDHVMGNRFVAEHFGLTLEINEMDIPVLQSAASVAQLYGINGVEPSPEPGSFLKEGDIIKLGNSILDVLHTPGHAPGHIVLVEHEKKYIVSGDVLFYGSIGRTDLPGGDFDTLINNIKEKLFCLGDDYQVFPGHGPPTDIKFEKTNNPFVQ